jgi:hypothetical protein
MGNFILQSEKIRWGQSIKSFETQEKTLCGDVLLTAAFVSYIGSFTRQYRQELVDCKWIPFLQQKVRPILHSVNMRKVLPRNPISDHCMYARVPSTSVVTSLTSLSYLSHFNDDLYLEMKRILTRG